MITMGRDSIVEAGSVVTRNKPPRTVAAGNPARIIQTISEKKLNVERQIKWLTGKHEQVDGAQPECLAKKEP